MPRSAAEPCYAAPLLRFFLTARASRTVGSCVGCATPLYYARSKFNSGCGWPAFYDGVPGAIEEKPDADGSRIEIVCHTCKGHLGHVFKNENFPTPTNERHCIPAPLSGAGGGGLRQWLSGPAAWAVVKARPGASAAFAVFDPAHSSGCAEGVNPALQYRRCQRDLLAIRPGVGAAGRRQGRARHDTTPDSGLKSSFEAPRVDAVACGLRAASESHGESPRVGRGAGHAVYTCARQKPLKLNQQKPLMFAQSENISRNHF